MWKPAPLSTYFYPRPPRGGRLNGGGYKMGLKRFLSTPSARRATRVPCSAELDLRISIHALREEGDQAAWRISDRCKISIHALREEGDPLGIGTISPIELISIHALREEGDPTGGVQPNEPETISIHALREEGDRRPLRTRPPPTYFYPRPPRGGRHSAQYWMINSHIDFYPRPPRGGRLIPIPISGIEEEFLSTPSARRATGHDRQEQAADGISIHALREEGDNDASPTWEDITQFLSTPSARRATICYNDSETKRGISIHALREEGDSKNRDKISIFKQIIQHSARI